MDDEGFEPSTFRMQNGRSTTELNALDQIMARVPRQTPLAPGIEPPLSDLESEVLPLHHEADGA